MFGALRAADIANGRLAAGFNRFGLIGLQRRYLLGADEEGEGGPIETGSIYNQARERVVPGKSPTTPSLLKRALSNCKKNINFIFFKRIESLLLPGDDVA